MKKTLYYNPNNDLTTITMYPNSMDNIIIEISDINFTHSISLSHFDVKEFANDLLKVCENLTVELKRNEIIKTIKNKYE